ncbi:MAG: ferredoxin, partial [Proteobacteria bacterium]|nr:ferredoxin [Pseudomonadota bacterium]
APPAEPPPAERSRDEAYIETIRCSSCNECTQINDRLFAYNNDKQAYIKDLAAGTYRQLVEAAESCQLSIIHPGKPRDPGEAGLAELIERAQPFL